MKNLKQLKPKLDKKTMGYLILVGQLGFLMVSSIIVFFWGGYYLDNHLNTGHVFKLVGLSLGILVGGYSTYKLTIYKFRKEDKNV